MNEEALKKWMRDRLAEESASGKRGRLTQAGLARHLKRDKKQIHELLHGSRRIFWNEVPALAEFFAPKYIFPVDPTSYNGSVALFGATIQDEADLSARFGSFIGALTQELYERSRTIAPQMTVADAGRLAVEGFAESAITDDFLSAENDAARSAVLESLRPWIIRNAFRKMKNASRRLVETSG